MTDDGAVLERLARLEHRLGRERMARREAESIAERVTAELYGALQELTSVNASLRDFVAVAAHDLRGPLTVILGFTELWKNLGDQLASSTKDEAVATIHHAGMQLQRLVDDLLTISKIEASEVSATAERLTLGEVIDEVVRSGPSTFEIDDRLAPEVEVYADRHHVQRVLGNLVTNAVKYGEPPLELFVERSDGWVDLHVRDHGAGVPESFLPRLFDRFARADEVRLSGIEGTGLGLAIVRGLARENGGDVWYETHEEPGACFVVRLPRSPAAQA